VPAPRPAARLAVASCLAALLATSGCSGAVGVDAPRLSGAAARDCRARVDALPDRVADLDRRDVDTGGGYGAAWGDPAIVLRCGVGRPAGFDAVSQCQTANGVDWFIPDDQLRGQRVDTTMTAVGRSRTVEVRVPAQYLPPVAAMVDLGPALKRTLREVKPCV
jgi:hypothetical protein